MKRRQAIWSSAIAVSLAAVAVSLTSDAVVLAEPDHDHSHEFRLEGAWQMTVTALSPAGISPFDSLMTFVPGGGLTETRRLYLVDFPGNTLLETPGAGNWERVSGTDDSYDVTFMFLLQGAPGNTNLNGAPFGTDKIRWKATGNPRTGKLSGPWESQITDLSGNVVFAASGVLDGKRIPIEPL
jgi:hypothetical protein